MTRQQLVALSIACSLLGCSITQAPQPVPVEISSQVIQLPAGGHFVNDSKGIKLKPGWYRFVRSEPGHRDNMKDVLVEAGKSFFIDLPPGTGFAAVSLKSATPQTRLELAGQHFALPFNQELDAGNYQAQLLAEGYRPLAISFEVIPGQPLNLAYTLEPLPTDTGFSLSTTPAATAILLNGVSYTATSLPSRLPFGDYQLTALHQLTADKRLTGQQSFSLKPDQPQQLQLALTTEQWRVNGQWLNKDEAKRQLAAIAAKAEQQKQAAEQATIAAELAVYLQHRIARPYQIEINQPLAAPDLPADQLTKALHRILQVGDRLVISTAQGPVTIWKRSPELTAAFSQAVSAWQQQQAFTPDFAEDAAESLAFTPGDQLLPSLAYQRYRFANNQPILDAGRAQLPGSGIQLGRVIAQGHIRLLAFGGEQLTVNGSDGQPTDGLLLLQLPADSAPVAISWQSPPQQLLVVSQHEQPLTLPRLAPQLKQGEKQDFNLPLSDITQIDVYTRLPDASWQHKSLQPTAIAGAVVPVSQSELGPHTLPGNYQRIWQVHYRQQGQLLSRQFSHQYSVTDEVQDGRSQNFLRRDN